MRLLSYNILDGGNDRQDLLAPVIESYQPDVVGLVEADDPAVLEQLAQCLKMHSIHAPGDDKASALLSRYPITRSINHALLNRRLSKSLLEVGLRDSAGVEWTLGVLHLHARATLADEQQRLEEIEEVLRIFQPLRKEQTPHLLMGDFNSHAPSQRIDPQRCKPSTQKAWEANGKMIPRQVVSRILEAGYLDSLRVFDPAAAEIAATFSTEFPGQRVDYIFTFGFEPSRIREAGVIKEPPAPQASDHFPVFARLE